MQRDFEVYLTKIAEVSLLGVRKEVAQKE